MSEVMNDTKTLLQSNILEDDTCPTHIQATILQIIEPARWKLKKIRDDEWKGFWFKWHCTNCDWSTGARPVDFRYCPNCGKPMSGIVKEGEYDEY